MSPRFRKCSDSIGGAVSDSLNGHRWLAAAGRDQAAAVAKEQILYVMRAVVRIDDGSFRIIPHAARAEQVPGELLFANRMRPFLLRASGVENLKAVGVSSRSALSSK